ncbi:MAG: hypothetical protein JEZ09_03170 [Salinivirgaceae bacterium]|nr:hypothetical protein [Salinivirgaceae bacterium]
MSFKSKCKYSNDCPIFLGSDKSIVLDLMVYKNVFCNRGEKGWSNCKKRVEFEQEEITHQN